MTSIGIEFDFTVNLGSNSIFNFLANRKYFGEFAFDSGP